MTFPSIIGTRFPTFTVKKPKTNAVKVPVPTATLAA